MGKCLTIDTVLPREECYSTKIQIFIKHFVVHIQSRTGRVIISINLLWSNGGGNIHFWVCCEQGFFRLTRLLQIIPNKLETFVQFWHGVDGVVVIYRTRPFQEHGSGFNIWVLSDKHTLSLRQACIQASIQRWPQLRERPLQAHRQTYDMSDRCVWFVLVLGLGSDEGPWGLKER